MNGARPSVSDIDVDLGQLFASVLRNWFRILLVALLVTGAAFAYAKLATPHYAAETRILIEARESVFTRPSGLDSERPLLDEEGVTSQVEVIRSSDILRQVAGDLDLASRSEFGAAGDLSPLGQIMVRLGLRSDPGQETREERVLNTMREKLNVYRVDRSRVIVISFSSEDPQLAAAVPNAIADAYIGVQQRAQLLSNADATEWLQPEIADLRQRVREAEENVAAYRAEADLMLGQGDTILANQELSEISTQLTQARAERSGAEARVAAIRAALENGAASQSLPQVLASPAVQRLRDRQVQLSGELADLSTTLLDNHPRIRSLRSQLEDVNSQMQREMSTVLESQESEAAAARQRELSLTVDVNRLKAAAAQAADNQVELRELEREASTQRALLESYLTRYREATSRAEHNYLPVDARIFARATPPANPYFPRTMPIVGAAFAGSALLLMVIVLLAELFSGRAMRAAAQARHVDTVDEVAMPAGTLILDDATREPNDAETTAHSDGTQSDSVEMSVPDAAARLIASGAIRAVFISPEGDEASATSVMVAREIADTGLRVIFLDLTASGAPAASMLETRHFPGITNLLNSEAQFSDIIHGDLYSDTHVIPLGTADPDDAMRAAERLPIILQSLATAYDIVVIECGPTNADGLRRVAGDETAFLMSVIEPDDADVAAMSMHLMEAGYQHVQRVSPAGDMSPPAPPSRSVA